MPATDVATVHYGNGPLEWPAILGLCLFLIAAGIVTGARNLIGDDPMEKPASRIAQLYGYSVCLIAVLVFIFSLQSFAENIITAREPLEGAFGYGTGSLTSFEAYKATYREPAGQYVAEMGSRTPTQPARSDAELRAQYEALRADRIASTRFLTQRDITVSALMLIVSVLLFALHWRWLRTQASV